MYADYIADPNDPNVSLVEFVGEVAVNQRRATLLSHVEQARNDDEIRKKPNAVNKAGAVLGGTKVEAYKIRLRSDATLMPKGTKEQMRGMLEALKVPLKKYCGDGPDLDGRSKVVITAAAMRLLLNQQVRRRSTTTILRTMMCTCAKHTTQRICHVKIHTTPPFYFGTLCTTTGRQHTSYMNVLYDCRCGDQRRKTSL